ncbi:MAG: hypothetical protein V4682_00110 [Patescibacteria group bacterium]
MIYFLDFDRTMFDTDAFIRDMRSKDASLDSCTPPELTTLLEERVKEGVLSFQPGELATYVYPDAAQFLRDKENAVTVITYGPRALQEAKTKSAFHGIPRVSVMYTDLVRKGPFLAPHTHLHRDAVLADDTPEELALLTEACPTIRLFEMRRDGGPGDGRWPTIRTLAELP